MPSPTPNTQEQGFRTSLWGFDKNDVLAYMNALANEAQQHELEYQEQVRQLQAQVERLKKDQANARVCVEKLQSDLSDANARADNAENEAEKKDTVTASQLEEAENKADSYKARYKECQQALVESQFKCRDLEKQLDAMAKQASLPATPAPTPAPETPPAPAPAVPAPPPPAPAPVLAPTRTVTEEARIEARKILADARISAETAEQHLLRQAAEQKERMADHARDLAAGVLMLRDRLARVDDKLSAATLDLENATAAIYEALDHTDSDLKAMGCDLRSFGEEKPASAPCAQPAAPGSAALRPKVAVQPVAHNRVRPVRQQPTPAQAKRLRRATHGRRPVSQELLDALDRLEDK